MYIVRHASFLFLWKLQPVFSFEGCFHQTSDDVVLFGHVPAFTSVALACYQCTSGLWMTSSHWADYSGLILCRGVGFLRWMCSSSLFTHWKILGVYGCDEAWPLTPYTWRSAFEQISWSFTVGPLFLVYFASFIFQIFDITCEWWWAMEFKGCKWCARQVSFTRCCPALRQREASSRFLLCSACLPWGSTGICEDSQLDFLVSSPTCLDSLRQFNEVFVTTFVAFRLHLCLFSFLQGLDIIWDANLSRFLIFAAIQKRNMPSLSLRVPAFC